VADGVGNGSARSFQLAKMHAKPAATGKRGQDVDKHEDEEDEPHGLLDPTRDRDASDGLQPIQHQEDNSREDDDADQQPQE